MFADNMKGAVTMNKKRLNRKNISKDVSVKKDYNRNTTKRTAAAVMNFAAPAISAAFLACSVYWASDLQYSEAVQYTSANDAVEVFAKVDTGVKTAAESFIVTDMPDECAGFSSKAVENSGAELIEAYGVYVDGEFVGAVVDKESVEDSLDSRLKEYTESDDIVEAEYSEEAEIKEGVYLTAALVNENEMTDYLGGEKKVVAEYEAAEGDTPEKIADDFDMTIEEVQKLNPDLEDECGRGETVKVVETQSVLPVKHVQRVQVVEDMEYDSETENVDEKSISSKSGEKLDTYEITFIDGEEVSRSLVESEPLEQTIRGSSDVRTGSAPEMQASNEFIWPAAAGYVSDPFGSDRNHKGMDIAAPYGTEIYAAADGEVIAAGWNNGGYGYFVKIDHGDGYSTLYGHASEVLVSEGQKVSAGDVVALVGSTGDSTGNHLHFEVRYNDECMNPAEYLE